MDKTKLKKKHIDFLNSNLPEIYFKIMDKDDYKSHYQLIKKTMKPENLDKVFHFKGDIEDFYSHKFCYDKLKSTLLKVAARVKGNIAVYRCFFNRSQDFVLSACYKSIGLSERINEFEIPTEDTIYKMFSNEDGKLVKNIDITINPDSETIVIQCVNIAFNTLLANIL